MVKLGLDVGENRIGVAISDLTETIAQPYKTLKRDSTEFEEIRKIVESQQVDEVIVGLPLSLKGNVTSQTERVREFSQRLKAYLNIPVKLWDERFTSKEARRVLKEAPLSRRREKGLEDKLAAALILQGYLESLRESK